MKTLFVLNDPPYGTERSYNGLRLANALAKRDGEEVRIFLMADAVSCALAGQQTPNGYYNLERLLGSAIKRGAAVGLCGTCMDARAVKDNQLVEGAHRSTLEELADWTAWADKVVTF
ncbi:MAG TPA: DsrE family protein [Gaiellaceae bacterium]|jgi:uncharacterized protein involved in oxidation of intracellular sulfur